MKPAMIRIINGLFVIPYISASAHVLDRSTECQEFYGAITLDSNEPLAPQIVTMLDVAIRGIGDRWNDAVIPGLDYIVIEDTLGKFGRRVEDFNAKMPRNVQSLVGNVSELH